MRRNGNLGIGNSKFGLDSRLRGNDKIDTRVCLPAMLRIAMQAGHSRSNRESRIVAAFGLIKKIFLSAFMALVFFARAGAESAPPLRIVCLAPSFDETIIELGLQDRIVGVTTSSDYLDEVKSAERIGLYIKPNLEKIIELNPDLILAAGFAGQQAAVKKLSALGVRVVVIDETRGLEEIFAKTKQIGDILGAGARTEALLERMRKIIEETRRKTAALPARPRVYVETGFDPLFTCGRGSFINDLVEIAGGKNIAGKIKQAFPRVSSEFVLSGDPEVIILPYMGRNFGKEALKQRTGWDKISAVKTGRVHDDIGANVITIPSPRLILYGLPELLKRIHPEINFSPGEKFITPRNGARP